MFIPNLLPSVVNTRSFELRDKFVHYRLITLHKLFHTVPTVLMQPQQCAGKKNFLGLVA
jgi:hypothetical protein